MAINKITNAERELVSVYGLPDKPGMSTEAIQQRFDGLGNLAIDKVNEVIEVTNQSSADIKDLDTRVDQIANNQIPEEYVKDKVDEYIAENQSGLATKEELEANTNQLSSEIVEIESNVNSINNRDIALYDVLKLDGYIENGGAFRPTNDTKLSDFIKVSQGDIVNFNLLGVGGFDILAFYTDKDINSYVSGINGNTVKGAFEVPSDGYIAVCCLNSYKDGYLYFSQKNDYLSQFVKANNNVKDLTDTYVLNFGDSCARGVGAWDIDLNN